MAKNCNPLFFFLIFLMIFENEKPIFFYSRIAPNLLHRVADIEHLVIVIATVFNDAANK